jgi:hypothetical protein
VILLMLFSITPFAEAVERRKRAEHGR